ncbi:hypothetical protein Patl1_00530 [Pistacia atlantica]|uniref:Uncharacterized protein n=1 Tax=Pistacia atlantica TaxID=434234 RepID=A0ACC1C578_9ROSI|nr:hypothetical protein Patl1_00530 [Pistacia atlantica]
MFLPGSVMDKSDDSLQQTDVVPSDLMFLKEMGLNSVLDTGSPSLHCSFDFYFYLKVFADLLVDPQQLLMVTVAIALREIGYSIQVYSLADGPAYGVWKNTGVPVTIIQTRDKMEYFVNWLNYDGILVNSLEAKGIFSRLMQEPFKSLPLIWTIHEKTLAIRSRQYASNGQLELVSDWKRVFNRATVVLFPDYVLPVMYSTFDSGNYYVIPGSPAEAWKADSKRALYNNSIRAEMGYSADDLVIAIVGSQFLYRGLWLEHAIVLQALLPLFPNSVVENESNSHIKIMILSRDSTVNYSLAIEAIALNLHYPRGIVKHIVVEEDADSVLNMADVVLYGSFIEEQSFPVMLMKAMCFGKPIIAPDLSNIRKYVCF